MQTPTLTRPKPTSGAAKRLRPDDFRRLGLGPTEARVSVIRRAARNLAKPLARQNDLAQIEQAEAELALVLAATYRLLDPRRRIQLIERVQLLRAEPTPLRSHLLEPIPLETLASELSPSEPEESEEDQPVEISEHDWMLESLAELRVEPPVWRRGSQRSAEARPAVDPRHDKHRAQMLEVARYLQSGRSRISKITGVLGGLGLLLVGIVMIVAFSWLSGNSKEVQADPRHDAQTSADSLDPIPPSKNSSASNVDAVEPKDSIRNPAKGIPPSLPELDLPTLNPELEFPQRKPTESPPQQELLNSIGSTENGASANDVLQIENAFNSTSDFEPASDAAPTGLESDLASSSPQPTLEQSSGIAATTSPAAPMTFLDTEIRAIPAEALAAPVRHPLPQPAELDEAIRRLRNVGVGQADGFPIGKSGVVELWRQANEATSGSVDRLAFGVLAGRQAVLIGEEALAMAISFALSTQFSASPARLGTVILGEAATEAATLTEQERVANWGLRVSDHGMVSEDYEAANEAARIATGVAAKHGSPDIRARLKQRRDSITIAQRMAASVDDQTLASPESADRSAAWNYGRHLCINQRSWSNGLAWLASGSDVRFSALATEELAIGEDAPANEVADVARRWLDLSDRRKGREQDSIRLHAHDLLLKAAVRADVIGRLEIGKEAQALIEKLPKDLLPISLDAAQQALGTGERDQPLANQPEQASDAATDRNVSMDTVSDPLTIGMLGRLMVSGQDTGILLRFPAAISIPHTAFDELLGRTGIAPGPIAVDFHGYVNIENATTVKIATEGPASDPSSINPSGVSLLISSGELAALRTIELNQAPDGYVAAVDLPAGVHRIVWKVSGEQFTSLRLLLSDDRDGQPLHLRHDQATEEFVRRLPVRLNVDFQAR